MRVGGQSKRDGAELWGEGEPSNSAMRQENMAAGASSGRGFDAGVVRRDATNGTESKRKIGDGGLHGERFDDGFGRGERQRDNGRHKGGTFQRVSGGEDSRIIGGRPSSTICCVKLKSEGEMLGNERMVETAIKAVDVPHHARWTMKYLEKVAEKLLSPASDLVDGSIIFEDFFDSSAIAKPKEFGTPNKFPVLADAPVTAAGFTNKGVIMTLSFGAAAGAKANGSETSTFHRDVEVADAVRAKEG
jgi:hypothetical protein